MKNREGYMNQIFLSSFYSVSVVKGKYPNVLLEQWDLYHERKVSENDRPGK